MRSRRSSGVEVSMWTMYASTAGLSLSCSHPSTSMVRNRSLPPAATLDTALIEVPYLYRFTFAPSAPLASRLCTSLALSPVRGTSGSVVSTLTPLSSNLAFSSKSSQYIFSPPREPSARSTTSSRARPPSAGTKWKCVPSTSCACGGRVVVARPYPKRSGYSSQSRSTSACLPTPAGPQRAMIRGGG